MLYFSAASWSVATLGAQVDAETLALPKDMQAAFVRLAERIEAFGLKRIGQPYVKHLQDTLWTFNRRLIGLSALLVHRYTVAAERPPSLAIF